MSTAAEDQDAPRVILETPRVRILPDGRMTRENAAKYLGYEPKTLAMWQMEGKGPKSVKVGGRRFYYQKVLDAFIEGEPEPEAA